MRVLIRANDGDLHCILTSLVDATLDLACYTNRGVEGTQPVSGLHIYDSGLEWYIPMDFEEATKQIRELAKSSFIDLSAEYEAFDEEGLVTREGW